MCAYMECTHATVQLLGVASLLPKSRSWDSVLGHQGLAASSCSLSHLAGYILGSLLSISYCYYYAINIFFL